MSLGPASLRLAAARSVIPFIPEVPRDSVALEDRSRNLDRLQDFLRSGKGKRDIEEFGARQVGGFDLAKLLAEQLKPNNIPREPTDLEDRARGADFLSKLIRLGNRDIVEVDTRQLGGVDFAKLLVEQLKSTNVPREPSDLEARTYWPMTLGRILGFGRRDIEDMDARQLGSFNLPHLVLSELAGRQVGSFDLSELLAHQFTREAQPEPAESSSKTLKLNRELAKELEEGIDHVAGMITRGLEHTLD